jgi:hypothetical protein
MSPPVAGKGLALWTGTAGCSAYQIDSKPSSSAFLAIKAGSMVYAGRGTDVPIFMMRDSYAVTSGDAKANEPRLKE